MLSYVSCPPSVPNHGLSLLITRVSSILRLSPSLKRRIKLLLKSSLIKLVSQVELKNQSLKTRLVIMFSVIINARPPCTSSTRQSCSPKGMISQRLPVVVSVPGHKREFPGLAKERVELHHNSSITKILYNFFEV